MTEAIPKLKVGDELAIEYGYPSRWHIHTIEKITPTGQIKIGVYVLNPDLTVRGRSGYGGPFHAYVATDSMREKSERADLLEKIERTKIYQLSTATLRCVWRASGVRLSVGTNRHQRRSEMEKIEFLQSAGKTIETVVATNYEQRWLVKFTDDTFAVIEAAGGWDGDGADLQDGYFDWLEYPIERMEQLGFITNEMAVAELSKRDDYRKQQEVSQERHDREQYARLHARFGGGTQ